MMMIMNAQVILAYIFLQKNLKREESMIHTLDTVTYFLIKLGMKPSTVFPRIVSAETILF
jgi:hypothetical protein